MVFASLEFLFLFLPVFIAAYFLMPKKPLKNALLFCGSVIFYAWGEPIYVLLIIFSMILNYVSGISIASSKSIFTKKLALLLSITINLGIIGYFKYTDFIIDNINNIFNLNIAHKNIPLPIGISFFTFQILTYVIDVYKNNAKVQKNPVYLGAYIFAFPQLIAGPIVRYQTVAEEIVDRKVTLTDFNYGLKRFMIGFSKKVLIANNMGFIVDSILEHDPSSYGAVGGWLAAIGYTLQLYFDFSGYSDMAIGLGRILGFHYLENFNYPYIAKSITDFWRRWHISLSSFFRDYVYIPLGGNRVKTFRWILNIFIVWFLTGLWHGASWNFVLWGLYYCILLLIEKLLFKKLNIKLPAFISHIYTLFFIIVGCILFRQENLKLIPKMIYGLFGGYGSGSYNFLLYVQVVHVKYLIALIAGIFASTPIVKVIQKRFGNSRTFSVISDIVIIALFIFSIGFVVSGSYNPFIYFKF